MSQAQAAQASDVLFHTAFFLYIAAMVAYFFRLAFTKVVADGVTAGTVAGRRIGTLGTALAVGGVAVHAGSVLARTVAAGWRMPLGNMYEYSSFMALMAVVVGLIVVQRRMGYGHLMGFVLAAAVLMQSSAILLYAEPGPLVPALQSYWLQIHVSTMMVSGSIFMVAFAVTALYLVKDAGQRRVAAADAEGPGGSGGGASTGGAVQAAAEGGQPEGAAAAATATLDDQDRPEGYEADSGQVGGRIGDPFAQREALSPVLFPMVPFVVVAVFTVWVWRAPVAALVAGSVAALLGVAAWYAVPYLPATSRLDNLAYRTIAFAMPIFTFGIIAGAIWAEEAWGRYWGWDPKETGVFFTWVVYAAYLHARSTHGWRGRRAAWIGVAGFASLMVTYYVVNLFIVGLHSYAGL